MANFLVTGGAGFIGSHLVARLIRDGETVRVVDDLSTGKIETIERWEGKIEFIRGDLARQDIARKSVAGMDYILHHAAIPSVPRSIDDPVSANRSIVTATVNLLKAAAESQTVKRVIQASSSAVYGDTSQLPNPESLTPNPISPYAVAKLTQEYYGRSFYYSYGLEVLSLRYFNVFGPGQEPDSFYAAVIPKFIALMSDGKRPTIYGDGTNTRDFIYVDNVVEANLLACRCPWPGNPEIMNIGSGEGTSLNQLVGMINSVLKTEIHPIYDKPRKGDIKHSVADITKARQWLNFDPKIDNYLGIEKLVAANLVSK